ncbi:MAG: aminopeptidase, partial [Candidatus Nitrotoga sp.]
MPTLLQKYATLLVHYCLRVTPGDKVYIATTTLAEPLLREVYREALAAGAALVEYDLSFRERERLFLQNASNDALNTLPPLQQLAMDSFDCYLAIRAPFNLREMQNAPGDPAKIRQEALQPINKAYFERTADRRLRRNLCQYP